MGRLELDQSLLAILQSENIQNAEDHLYFQPPANIALKYPCIIYSRDNAYQGFANNKCYIGRTRYEIKVIDRNPDSVIPNKVSKLQYTSFNTHYIIDNLNHDVYSTYS